jgi:hypothetical protein
MSLRSHEDRSAPTSPLFSGAGTGWRVFSFLRTFADTLAEKRMRTPGYALLIVALVVMVSTSVSSLASPVRWFCDGRLCGLSLCCCDQPDVRQTDPNCARSGSSSSERPALCATGCGCTPVFTASSDSPIALMPAPSPSSFPIFVLSEAPVALVAVLWAPTVLALLPDFRGPPTVRVALPASGLRAPPAS